MPQRNKVSPATTKRHRLPNSEPEIEVHPSRSPTLASKMSESESPSLRSMIQRQASTMIQLRKTEATETTSEESKCDSDSQPDWHAAFELTSSHAWSESDETSLPATLPGSFHDSIEAIREEALRVDAAIALDQLDTMKDELASLKKELTSRDSEIQDLRASIQVKDTRLSTLELERDLFRADAGCESENSTPQSPELQLVPVLSPSSQFSAMEQTPKADDQLRKPAPAHPTPYKLVPGTYLTSPPPPPPRQNNKQELVLSHPQPKIASVGSPFRPPARGHELGPTKIAPVHVPRQSIDHAWDSLPPTSRIAPIHEFGSAKSTDPASSSLQLVPRTSQAIAYPSPMQITPIKDLHTPTDHRRPHPTTANGTQMLVPSRIQTALQPRQLQYDEIITSPSAQTAQDDVSLTSRSSMNRNVARPRSVRGPSLQDESSSVDASSFRSKKGGRRSRKEQFATDDPNDTAGQKTCLAVPKPRSLLGRRKKQGRQQQDQQKNNAPSYQTHAEELTHLLRTSLETSEELRKRLVVISSYYENVVQDLQKDLKTGDEQRKKVERDLLDQIAALELAKKKLEQESDSKHDKEQRTNTRLYPYGKY